ncbi:MAG: hypothetical protein JO304_08460 [Solirubrobacterales bacterium]|nr:hypothetical protein [Solirubrobacterales bacterium]
MGEVERQVRAGRGIAQAPGELDVGLRCPIGLDRIGDVLAEQVDRAEHAGGGQPASRGQRVVNREPGHIA